MKNNENYHDNAAAVRNAAFFLMMTMLVCVSFAAGYYCAARDAQELVQQLLK